MARTGLLFCLALSSLLAAGSAGAQTARDGPSSPPAWRIVLIRSWDSLYPINIARETALRNAIIDAAPRVVEFFPEEIDPLRFSADLEREFVELLTRKYRETPVDVVVASGIEPLEFVSRHRDTIWPGAAIVFNGVFEGALDGWSRPPGMTGVMLALDVEGTMALGRALVPTARRIHVISGTSGFDVHIRELVLRKISRANQSLEVHRVDGLSRAETVQQLARLGPSDLVLYLTMLRDGAGAVSGPVNSAIPYIAERSPVPVLTLFQTQFRRGAVGGSAPRIDQHGQQAGRLVRRVL